MDILVIGQTATAEGLVTNLDIVPYNYEVLFHGIGIQPIQSSTTIGPVRPGQSAAYAVSGPIVDGPSAGLVSFAVVAGSDDPLDGQTDAVVFGVIQETSVPAHSGSAWLLLVAGMTAAGVWVLGVRAPVRER